MPTLLEPVAQHPGRPFVAALLALCAASPALAADRDIHVEKHTLPGQEVRARTFPPRMYRCQPAGQPTVKVTASPAHGGITTRSAPMTIKATNGGQANGMSCDSVQVDGMGVYYKPQEGFAGADHFELEVDYPGTTKSVHAAVDIVVAPGSAQ